jgi:levoglucosan dehydrogenase
MDHIGIGMVGYGMIGRVHCLGYRDLPILYPGQLPDLLLAAICTRHEETAKAAVQEAGFQAWYTHIDDLLQDGAVNVIDCCVPNDAHHAVIKKALLAGKHVYCDKPLALNAAQANDLVQAAEKTGVQLGMTFNYRFLPAIMRASEILRAGELGEIFTFRLDYLHSGYQNPSRPMGWRLRKEQAGGGALVDLGSHVIDLVRHLLGEVEALHCSTRTFIQQRPVSQGASVMESVQVDDAAWVQTRLRNGAEGSLHVSRFATGAQDDLSLEIYGRLGGLRFNLMDPNWLYWYDARRPEGATGGERGWTRVETVQRYPGASGLPARAPVGWGRTHAENQFAFLRALHLGQPCSPNIMDGYINHLVIEAAYASAETGEWVKVPWR